MSSAELRRLQAKKKLKELQENLPHLYAFKRYEFQKEFIESTNRMSFLCCANQLGKSSCQIIKVIKWATEPKLWPTLWAHKPKQFWYLYPSLKRATQEFREKWAKELLPQGEMKDHPVYGWKAYFESKVIDRIEFNSGISVYFQSYSQNADNIQSGTVDALFTDEELPEDIFDELIARVRGTNGYFHMVFTATHGYEMWRRTVEERGTKHEKFPSAWKRQVSLWDCLKYEDGSQSPWTPERIREEEARCSTHAEVQRRIYGRFIKSEGLRVPQFNIKRHMIDHEALDPTWNVWGAIDSGSGGGTAHSAGIVLMAVNKDGTAGRVFRCWRGDDVDTTSSYILQKYQEMTTGLDVTCCVYDWSCRDLFLVAQDLGVCLTPAKKSRDDGFDVLNSLFKHDMLKVMSKGEGDEAEKLKIELMTYSVDHSKKKVKNPDNLIDPLRYVCMAAPWDINKVINNNLSTTKKKWSPPKEGREYIIDLAKKGRLRDYVNKSYNPEGDNSVGDELSDWANFFGEVDDEFYFD